MPISDKVVVAPGGIHGSCWWAKEDIKEGELIWWTNNSIEFEVHLDEIKTWSKEKQDKFYSLAYQVDDDTFVGVAPGKVATQDIQNEDYVNHSCDGNMWFDGSDVSYPIFIIYKDKYGKLIAKRDIKQGEELTYDYAMTEASNECLCNSTNCRKIVTGSDYLIPEIRKQYEGHFLPHIRKKLKHFDEQKKS